MFSVDKEAVYLGQEISVENKSDNMKYYKWDFGDGSGIVKEDMPGPWLYKNAGNYEITLEASHRKRFNKVETHTVEVGVESWIITGITINSVPNFDSWDSNSGPDIKMKINNASTDVSDFFYADHTIYFPYNIEETDLPITEDSLNIEIVYTDWEFRLLDDEFPLPNQSMNTWTANGYKNGNNGKIKLDGDGYDIDLNYIVNNKIK